MTAQSDGDASESTDAPRLDTSAVDDVMHNHSLSPATEHSEQWLTAALEEYGSIRAEIIDAIDAQRKIMQLGITSLSVLIGLGVQQIRPLLAVVLLTLLTPTVAIFITAGALGELFRAARASSFLAHREQIVNRVAAGPYPALEWEQWLRRGPIFIVRDRAEFLAVFSLTTGALVLGFHTMFTSDLYTAQPELLVITLGVFAVLLWIASPILHAYLVRRARRQFLSEETSIDENGNSSI